LEAGNDERLCEEQSRSTLHSNQLATRRWNLLLQLLSIREAEKMKEKEKGGFGVRS
jgi:hypothetical protein